jgi:hypothetical protein
MRPLTMLFGLIVGAGGLAGGLSGINGGTEDFSVTVNDTPQLVYSAFDSASGYGSALRDSRLMVLDKDVVLTREQGKAITWHVPSSVDSDGSTVTLTFVEGDTPGKTVIRATVDVAPVHDINNTKLVVSEDKVAGILKEAVRDVATDLERDASYRESGRTLNGVFDLVAIATNPGMAESLNRSVLDAFGGNGGPLKPQAYGESAYGKPDDYGKPTDDFGAPMIDPGDPSNGY